MYLHLYVLDTFFLRLINFSSYSYNNQSIVHKQFEQMNNIKKNFLYFGTSGFRFFGGRSKKTPNIIT